MKPFHFKQFSIEQSKAIFRVGTDGVLLGALADCKNSKKILEVGTGTGLISLMIAQRNPNAKILALDINPEAVDLANKNFSNSPFSKRLIAIVQDFKTFETSEVFDFIVCNPPYFEKIENSTKDILARQQVELNFEQLIKKSIYLLSKTGILSVIIPKSCEISFIKDCQKYGLKIQRKINIKGNTINDAKRCVLEFSFDTKERYIEKELILEISPRQYSAEYLELTKDFHLFKHSIL